VDAFADRLAIQVAVDKTILYQGAPGPVLELRTEPFTAGSLVVRSPPGEGPASALGSATVSLPKGGADVTVVVRPTGRFVPLTSESGTCVVLDKPRAAHQATLLTDGRVLVTGGYDANGTDPIGHTYHRSAEMVNVAAGSVDPAPPAEAFGEGPRAHHSALRLKDGRVAVLGGERAEGSQMVVTPTALVYDPIKNDWSVLDRMRAPRSRAQVGIDLAGRVLLLGGYRASNGVYEAEPSYEWFDPGPGVFRSGMGTVAPRAMGGLHELQGVAFVAAGGSDGRAPLDSAVSLRFNEGQGFMPESKGIPALAVPRTRSAFARLGPDWLLVAGGDLEVKPELVRAPSSAVDLLPYGVVKPPAVAPLKVPRADACAVLLPPGAGRVGTAFVLGGETSAGAVSSAVTAVHRNPSHEVTVEDGLSLVAGRARHSCTALADGSVLVIGGDATRGKGQTLRSIEIFVPSNAPP
jgi:hypothetical protein